MTIEAAVEVTSTLILLYSNCATLDEISLCEMLMFLLRNKADPRTSRAAWRAPCLRSANGDMTDIAGLISIKQCPFVAVCCLWIFRRTAAARLPRLGEIGYSHAITRRCCRPGKHQKHRACDAIFVAEICS